MSDRATPNLPSNDLAQTEAFYAALGFTTRFRDRGWLILVRGSIELEFFPMAIDPKASSFGACLRVGDLDALHAAFAAAGLPSDPCSIPRLTAPRREPFGLRMFALVDADGSLLRCLEDPAAAVAT